MPSSLSDEVVIVRPSRGWMDLNLRELWRYRELVYFLTWRNIKVRYKQTFLGAAWAILQPLLTMVVFTLFFGRLAKIPSDNVPYPIFSYAALLPWQLFSKALTDAGRSLVSSRNMITKVYFPRLAIPLSTMLSGLVDFALAFIVLLGMMVYYHVTPTAHVWTILLFLPLALITALGVGLWLSALNVLYRDVGYTLPFLTQAWMFITPIAYSSTLVPPKWRLVYALNPMAGVVNGFRWALLDTPTGPDASLAVSVAVAVVLLISGLYFFRRMERQFADRV